MNASSIIIARSYGERNSDTLTQIKADIQNAAGRWFKIILDGGRWVITSDFTFDENMALEILPDSIVSINNGVTLTINSSSFIIHRTDWYAGDGTIAGKTVGNFLGRASEAAIADGISNFAVGEGLEIVADQLAVKQATDSVLGGSKAATVTKIKEGLSESLFATPASLVPFLFGNVEFRHFDQAESVVCADRYSRYEFPTRLGITITPKLAGSKILVFGSICVIGNNSTYGARVFLNRKIGDAASSEIFTGKDFEIGDTHKPLGTFKTVTGDQMINVSFCVMDLPSSLEPIEYFLTFTSYDGQTIYLNRNENVNITPGYYTNGTTQLVALELPQQT